MIHFDIVSESIYLYQTRWYMPILPRVNADVVLNRLNKMTSKSFDTINKPFSLNKLKYAQTFQNIFSQMRSTKLFKFSFFIHIGTS